MHENVRVLACFREKVTLWLLSSALLAPGCAKAPPPRPPEGAAPAASGTHEIEPLSLSLDQLAIRERLVTHSANLTKIGERNFIKDWELAEAGDYIASEWEKLGLRVERVGFVHAERTFTNLTVAFEGNERKEETIVLLAPYDSKLGSRGESAAFSAAILLELTRFLAESRHGRTVRLWALAMSEALPESAPSSGDRVAEEKPLATSLIETPGRLTSEKPVLVVKLENLGRPMRSSSGESRVAIVGGGDEEAAKYFEEGLEGAGLSVERSSFGTGATIVSQRPGADLAPFHSRGVPVLRVAGSSEDGPIDADFSAIVASRLRFALGRVAQNAVTNDGMLTPDLGKDR